MAAKKRAPAKVSARVTSKKARPAKRAAASAGRRARPAAKAPAKSSKAAARSTARKPPVGKAAKAAPTKRPAAPQPAPRPAAGARSPSRPVVAKAPLQRPFVSRKLDTGPVTSSVGLIHGIPPYQPKSGESYMNDKQLDHFRSILLAWKRELMEEVDRTVHHMQDEASNFPDPNDRATQESEFGLELRTRDRERKLLKKIDSALERIEDGSYGYCEETGEEIGLKRLEARPVATLSVEAQERRELAERQFRDREDGF